MLSFYFVVPCNWVSRYFSIRIDFSVLSALYWELGKILRLIFLMDDSLNYTNEFLEINIIKLQKGSKSPANT